MATASEQDPYVELLKRQIKRAEKLRTDHLGCRRGALGHNWIAVQPDFEVKVRGAIGLAYQCQACLAIKRGVISKKYGEWLTNPNVEYPDGYIVPKERDEPGPSLSAQSVRAAFVARVQSETEKLPPITALRHERVVTSDE